MPSLKVGTAIGRCRTSPPGSSTCSSNFWYTSSGSVSIKKEHKLSSNCGVSRDRNICPIDAKDTDFSADRISGFVGSYYARLGLRRLLLPFGQNTFIWLREWHDWLFGYWSWCRFCFSGKRLLAGQRIADGKTKLIRRAPEPYYAHADASVYTAHQCVFEEIRKPHAHGCALYGLV